MEHKRNKFRAMSRRELAGMCGVSVNTFCGWLKLSGIDGLERWRGRVFPPSVVEAIVNHFCIDVERSDNGGK